MAGRQAHSASSYFQSLRCACRSLKGCQMMAKAAFGSPAQTARRLTLRVLRRWMHSPAAQCRCRCPLGLGLRALSRLQTACFGLRIRTQGTSSCDTTLQPKGLSYHDENLSPEHLYDSETARMESLLLQLLRLGRLRPQILCLSNLKRTRELNKVEFQPRSRPASKLMPGKTTAMACSNFPSPPDQGSATYRFSFVLTVLRLRSTAITSPSDDGLTHVGCGFRPKDLLAIGQFRLEVVF